MKIYGIDFTSAPSYRKPITCVECILNKSILKVNSFINFYNFNEFEKFLDQGGEWVAGIDFPFWSTKKIS